jgi:hypothetical protein
MGVAWGQNGGLTRKSRGLMETARARTSTSRGFRSGTGTPCLISSTSGPPKRGTTTARQVFSAAAVDAGRHPSRRQRALTALHHIALEHTELQRLRLRLASGRRQCRRGARGDRTRWGGGGEGECGKGLRTGKKAQAQRVLTRADVAGVCAAGAICGRGGGDVSGSQPSGRGVEERRNPGRPWNFYVPYYREPGNSVSPDSESVITRDSLQL